MSGDSRHDIDKIKKENSVLRRYAAIQKATEERVCCQKIYVDIAGGLTEALVLDELIFFTLPRPETGKSGLRVRKEGVLWMAVSRTEWWERKRLTPKEADGAIERLIKLNIIFKDHFLFNKQKTTHLRLNVEEFFKRYSEELEKQNPPEDESDTILKDISDLYEMMGVPKEDTPKGIPDGNTGIPDGEGVSLNGDSINSPDASLTHPLIPAEKKKVPDNYSEEWKILAGEEITEKRDEKEARIIDAANLIAMGMKGTDYEISYGVAYTFMHTRGIVIAESKIKSQRKPLREMIESGVLPNHAMEATKKLMDANMTVADLYSISRTAIDIANKPENKREIRGVEYDANDVPMSY